MIPFLELKRQYESIRPEVNKAIQDTLNDGFFVLGKRVEEFEKKFAQYCNVKHCISVGSGTDALNLAAMALGISDGDEVLMPSHTFIATAFAATNLRARPVFVDIDEKTYNISASEFKKAASVHKNAKAAILVHLYGQYCDMDEIMPVAKKNNIKIIEDCSQSHGAEYKGERKLFGDVGCYSFYPTKNLGCYGDGGAIVTNDDALADKLRLLRNYGQREKYQHISFGYNSRLDEMQAAVLLVKLKHLDKWNSRRREIAQRYNELLRNAKVVTPYEARYAKHVYYLYVIRVSDRSKLQQYLTKAGIHTQIHYPTPVHRQRAFSEFNSLSLPVTENTASEILSLPMFPELTDLEVAKVAQAIRLVR